MTKYNSNKKHEPRITLDGGNDRLDLIKKVQKYYWITTLEIYTL